MNIEKIIATIAAATFTLTIYADGGETVATQAYRDLRWLDRDTLFTGEIIEKLAPDIGFSPFVVWTGEGWADVSRGSDINTMFDTLITIGFEQNLSAMVGEGAGRIGVSAFYYAQSGGGTLGGLDSSQGCFFKYSGWKHGAGI